MYCKLLNDKPLERGDNRKTTQEVSLDVFNELSAGEQEIIHCMTHSDTCSSTTQYTGLSAVV